MDAKLADYWCKIISRRMQKYSTMAASANSMTCKERTTRVIYFKAVASIEQHRLGGVGAGWGGALDALMTVSA